MDKKCRKFIWGDSNNQRKIHTVVWNQICKPKNVGGLGLRSSMKVNSAFMMKAGWDLCSEHDDLWVRIFRSKYKYGDGILPYIDKN